MWSVTRTQDDDQALAYDAIPSAWPGLSFDRRQDVIDLLSTYSFDIAFNVLLKSSSLDPKIADLIRKRTSAVIG